MPARRIQIRRTKSLDLRCSEQDGIRGPSRMWWKSWHIKKRQTYSSLSQDDLRQPTLLGSAKLRSATTMPDLSKVEALHSAVPSWYRSKQPATAQAAVTGPLAGKTSVQLPVSAGAGCCAAPDVWGTPLRQKCWLKCNTITVLPCKAARLSPRPFFTQNL